MHRRPAVNDADRLLIRRSTAVLTNSPPIGIAPIGGPRSRFPRTRPHVSVHQTTRRLVVAVSLVFGVACQPGAGGESDSGITRAPGDAAREWAIQIDRARPELLRREWKSTMGDAEATLSGYSAGDTLRLVREVLAQGDRGRQASRYYFAGAWLRYFESEGDLVAQPDPVTPAVIRKERVVLAFDDAGATVEVSRLVDGATAPMDSARIQGVVARAAEVARQWAAAPVIPQR